MLIMRRIITVCTIISLLVVISCNDNKISDLSIEKHSLDDCKEGTIEDLFSDVELIELRFDDKYYPKAISRMFIESGMVFVHDNRNNIYIYTEDGTPISSSLKMRGEGPGEHPFVMGFSWNPHSQLAEIITPYLLMFYDKNFNFVKSTRLESRVGKDSKKGMMYRTIYDLSSDLHLMAPTGASERPWRLIVYDSSKEKNIGEISYEEDLWSSPNIQSNHFFVLPDSTIYCHPQGLLPYTYILDPENLTMDKAIEIESGSRCITLDDIKKLSGDEIQIAHYLHDYEKPIPVNTIVTSDKLFVMLKRGNTIRGFSTVVFDRNSSEKKEYSHYKNGKFMFPKIDFVKDNYVYAIVSKDALQENPALYLNNPANISNIDSFDEENWILLKYKYN